MDASLIVHSGSPALVGRDLELAVLREGLEQARAGHLRVVLLSGEPGIGKSRLLDEFPSYELAGAGLVVLRGGATRGEGLPPYLPFIEALGDYAEAVSVEVLREVVGTAGAVLASILPRLAERLGPLPTPPRLAPEEERRRLFEAVSALVARTAQAAPLVLSLDDLQWADAASCDLLVHLTRRLANSSILVLGAYRDAEAEDNPSFVHALAELTRLRVLRIVRVGRLNIAHSTALASDLLGGEIPEAVAAALHRQGEGNPFCLEELTRGLIEEGSLTRRDGRWALERPVEQRLPPGLTATIRSRLSRLPRQSLDVLVIGAVVGRGFDLDVVAAVSGSDPDTIEASLLPAVRGALVRPQADGSYAFTHDTIRETLYTDLAPGRARRLHLAIGEALESLAPQLAQGLAFHFVKAGDVERGVRYAQAAGEHALRAQAPASAVGYYQQAAELIALRPDDPRTAQVQLALGEAHTRTGDFNAAVTSLRRAAEAAQRDQNLPLAADAWRRVGSVRWRQEQLLEARIAFERALELYGDTDGLGAAETLLQLADLMALSLGQHADAERCATRALAMVRRLGDDRLAALASRAMGSVRFRANRLAEGRAFLEDALTLALRQDDAALAAEICGHLASAAGFAGDLTRSREVTLLRRQLAQRTDDPFLLRHVAIWLGVLAVFQGRWEEVQAHLAEAAPDVERVDSPEPRAFLHVLRGLLAYYTGRLNAALVEFQAAQATIRTLGSDAGLWFNGWTGMVLVELGRPAEATASFLELRRPADQRDAHDSVNAYAYSQLIHGYHALGERQQAAECYERLAPV